MDRHEEMKTFLSLKRNKTIGLEELFGIPTGKHLAIHPTKDAWGVDRANSSAISMGEGNYSMYIGIGFLLLGPQYMLVGMHEGGHIQYPGAHEREAWRVGLTTYKRFLRKNASKEEILHGESRGLFGLLNVPGEETTTPRIVDIVQFGLLSYHNVEGESIPSAWLEPQRLQASLNKAEEVHLEALVAYQDMMAAGS